MVCSHLPEALFAISGLLSYRWVPISWALNMVNKMGIHAEKSERIIQKVQNYKIYTVFKKSLIGGGFFKT